jgi:hypothetical protein
MDSHWRTFVRRRDRASGSKRKMRKAKNTNWRVSVPRRVGSPAASSYREELVSPAKSILANEKIPKRTPYVIENKTIAPKNEPKPQRESGRRPAKMPNEALTAGSPPTISSRLCSRVTTRDLVTPAVRHVAGVNPPVVAPAQFEIDSENDIRSSRRATIGGLP